MSELLPKLKEIMVDPQKLHLDPNNPRFVSHERELEDPSQAVDPDMILKTQNRMSSGGYDIELLKASILRNGWQPVDAIFVRHIEGSARGRYVVLEGNRRVVAIKALLISDNTSPDVREQLAKIRVMELVDKIDGRRRTKSEQELRKKIDYLLGVRHHGSLKTWTPFAQASYIYEAYLAQAQMSDDEFLWDASTADILAETLGMKSKDVKERIRVFRAMRQIGATDIVKDSESGEGDNKGGMTHSYYSVCREGVLAKDTELAKYICQSEDEFLLDGESLRRIILLCHFDKKARKESPINNPQQWRYLGKILTDIAAHPDDPDVAANLDRVEVGKERPQEVWAKRETDLQRLEWGGWLEDIARLMGSLTAAKLDDNEESIEVMKRLSNLLARLRKACK